LTHPKNRSRGATCKNGRLKEPVSEEFELRYKWINFLKYGIFMPEEKETYHEQENQTESFTGIQDETGK